MDYRLKNGNIGEYIPAFFEMKINIDKELDLNKFNDTELSIFFHEYIHFLQDITTLYGLNLIYLRGEYINTVVNEIRKKEEKGFLIPYSIDDNEDLKHQEEIYRITLGDCGAFIKTLNINEIIRESYELSTKSESLSTIDIITLFANEDDYISFGAYAIKENIAYIMERECSSHYVSSPDFPYRAAEIVAQKIYPEFAKNIHNILALADCSLMFSNPAVVFVDMLYQMKSKEYLPFKPQDVYYQLPFAKVLMGDKKIPIFECYEIVAREGIDKLKSYFNTGVSLLHEPYYKWIDTVFDTAIKLRTKHPYFLLDLIHEGEVSKNNYFVEILDMLGTPMMRNMRKEYYSIKPLEHNGWNVEVMKSVQQMYNLLHNGEVACSLYPWCESTQREHPDEELNPSVESCIHKPWERCKEPQLCPLGLIWKNWGLSEYIPIPR